MFQLTLIDHIRLSFAGVLSAYEGHADAAARLVRWAWYGKMTMLGILGLGGCLHARRATARGRLPSCRIRVRGAGVRDLGNLRGARSGAARVCPSRERGAALAALRKI